jgi:hypothetical protein
MTSIRSKFRRLRNTDGMDELTKEYAAIIAEARAAIAARQEPTAQALEARIRAAGGDPKAEQRALQQLERVLSVHRSRALLTREPSAPAPPPPAPSLRAALKVRPMISANMEVRQKTDGDRFLLTWETMPAIAGWEVRFSERPDARGDYEVLESLALPPETTTVELPLGDKPLRVHLLGRSRDGRLLRRAVISALTRGGWNDRWERRASAS